MNSPDPLLTARQAEILDYIKRRIADGVPPTRAEIANDFGFNSINAAVDHMRALERKGVITMQPGISRGIRLVSKVIS